MIEIKRKIEGYIWDKNLDKAFKELSDLNIKTDDIESIKWRADMYFSLQKFANALNDYGKVLKIEPENKIISSKIEMIRNILRFQAEDIYGSTNLNKDPWLDN